MIILDTSAVIDFTRGNSSLAELITSAESRGQQVAVTSLSVFELLIPFLHRRMPNKERVLRAFLLNVRVLPFDSQAAEQSARIMSSLLKVGKPLNVVDAMIAGIASSNNSELLITKDKDFKVIESVTDLNIRLIS